MDSNHSLAADSRIARFSIDDIGQVLVIEANYYGTGKYNRIRGTQPNGRYFVLKVHGTTLELIGILHGNRNRWNNVGTQRQLITSWHLSAAESPETEYTWDGNRFEPIALSQMDPSVLS